jgi:Ulp1 family protease
MWKQHESKVVFFRTEGSADKVTVNNFRSLQPGEWLDDNIANCYVRMTQEMATRWNSKVKLLNSQFFSKIEDHVTRDFIVSCFFFFNPFYLF